MASRTISPEPVLQTQARQRLSLQQRQRSLLIKRRTRQTLWYVVTVTLLVLFLSPFAWLIITALKTDPELATFPIQWLPAHPQFDNFMRALTQIDYGRYLLNTIFLSTLYATLVTASSALVGFGFARLRGWGKRPVFMLMLSTMMLPQIITLIPTYIVFSRVGLVDTYWPWVLWGLASTPYLSFLFRQFFSSIPGELEEAAILDGCGYFGMLWRIFLPLARPAIATAFVLSFAGVWGDYVTPTLFLSDQNATLSLALSSGYLSPHGDPLNNILAAGVILYIVPVLVVFFIAQRSFIRGIVTSGLK